MAVSGELKQVCIRLQQEAAHDERPQVRLIAGPGTGKSATIEERVFWLLDQQGVGPWNIRVASFTRSSAMDLERRIYKYCEDHGYPGGKDVRVSTLHSLALHMLSRAGLLRAYAVRPMVLDDWELHNVFDAEFAHAAHSSAGRCEKIREQYEAHWSTGQWDPADYIPPDPPVTEAERNCFHRFHGPRAQLYCCVLPGEIVRACLEHICAGTLDPLAQLHIEHLIVDEYQDLNPCDVEFVDHLTCQGVSTFVAGDDDQSVYSFRFASPRGIQDFLDKYPDGGDHRLEGCFRCTPAVVGAATSVIECNSSPKRIAKKLYSLHEHGNPKANGVVHRWKLRSGVAEARAIAESCRDLIAAGVAAGDIIVLISNRPMQEQSLETAFTAASVPYRSSSADKVKDSQEGRLALSLLRVVRARDDYVAHRTLLGLMPGVGIVTCSSIGDVVLTQNMGFINLFYGDIPQGCLALASAMPCGKPAAY